MAHLLQDRFSALVDEKLRYELVQKNGSVWNNRYEGDPKAGAVKIPVRDTEVVIGAYSKTAGKALTAGATAYATVTIDKDYAVNEIIDGYDAAAVPDGLVADRLDSAGYSLATQMNSDGTVVLVANGTPISTAAAMTDQTVYGAFVDARTTMSNAKVPIAGRFALVRPETFALILKSAEFIKASALGDAVVQSGALGQIAGFNIFEDATLPANASFIVGHPNWCTRIEEWAVPVKLQDLAGSGTFIGASAVQGRKVYAHYVTKPQTLFIKPKILNPVITVTGGATDTAAIVSTNATTIKYRFWDASAGTPAWSAWGDYSTALQVADGDKIEAYGTDTDGIKTVTVSHTVTATELT